MKITTRFNLGDFVYQIHKGAKSDIVACSSCGGKGFVKVNDHRFTCDTCYGRGSSIKTLPTEWRVNGPPGKIGNIKIDVYDTEWVDGNTPEKKVVYMLDTTGVGSGTLHHEADLFGTKEEAEAACKLRNNIPKVE